MGFSLTIPSGPISGREEEGRGGEAIGGGGGELERLIGMDGEICFSLGS